MEAAPTHLAQARVVGRSVQAEVVADLAMKGNLVGTTDRSIVRIGDTVRRSTYPWSSSIHGLLQHLEAVDFPYAPRFLGIDDDGREILSFIEGDSGRDGWAHVVPESGLRAFVGLLRAYHEAVRDFRPTTDWCVGSRAILDDELVLHGDFGPWNIVWCEGHPVAVLDWDLARPGPALDDLAYAAWYVVPFRPDAECTEWLGYRSAPDRRARLAIIADAYGVSAEGLVERVMAVQEETRDIVASLASRGVEPQASWQAQGYLDELQARLEWTRANAYLVR